MIMQNDEFLNKAKRNDIILIVLTIFFAGLIFVFGMIFKTPGDEAVVFLDGQEYARMPLNRDCTLDIDGRCVLNISGGEAEIESAACPNQICVMHRPISKTGEAIVCAPGGVAVKIDGKDGESGPDFIQ